MTGVGIKVAGLSPFVRVGSIVHSVDGSMYICTSKLASGDSSVRFKLTDLQGKPVNEVRVGWRPISPALARFAAWVRLAYNKDFDLYVKEYIRAAGLPVDPTMNWSRFFQARLVPKLISHDPEVEDEAIHHIIIKTLAERSILLNFPEAIKKFPERIQELPLARQVTVFLMQSFNWRVMEANRYIKEFVFQDKADSMWGEGEKEGEDVNLLDTEDKVDIGAYEIAEADIDVGNFRRGFSTWLHRKYSPQTADQYLAVFDLLYEETKSSDDPPRARNVLEAWYRQFNRSEGEGTEVTRAPEEARNLFRKLFYGLPRLIDTYIVKNLSPNYRVHPFLEIMRQLKGDKGEAAQRLRPAYASFGGLKLAEDFPINHDIEAPAPSSDDSKGNSGLSLPAMGEDAGEGVAGALDELAPLALAASSQWEVPTCNSCGSTKETRDCLACHKKFCGDCIINHHANNPSHDRVASKKAAKKQIKWKVDPPPTGRWRSFQKRGWPSADYADGSPAIYLYANREYESGITTKDDVQGLEIKINLADHSEKPVWKWKTLKRRAKNLKEAKALAESFLSQHPEFASAAKEPKVEGLS